MKAFPLIFSRTKNEDFVPDFLVRPSDLDVKEALKYIHNVMYELGTLKSVRYSTFLVGDYGICGISFMSKYLVQKIGASVEEISDYLIDCKGRNLVCFIGFAIPLSETNNNIIPDISLEKYWNTYLEYIKHQWEDYDTKSEQIQNPCINLNEKAIDHTYKPTYEIMDNKSVILHYEAAPQKIIDYYLKEVLCDHNSDASFVSDVIYKEQWDVMYFKNVAVTEQLYTILKTAPKKQPTIGSPAKPSSQRSQMNVEVKSVAPKSVSLSTLQSENKTAENESKKKTVFSIPLLVAVSVAVLIILIIAIRK